MPFIGKSTPRRDSGFRIIRTVSWKGGSSTECFKGCQRSCSSSSTLTALLELLVVRLVHQIAHWATFLGQTVTMNYSENACMVGVHQTAGTRSSTPVI